MTVQANCSQAPDHKLWCTFVFHAKGSRKARREGSRGSRVGVGEREARFLEERYNIVRGRDMLIFDLAI